MLTLPIGFIMLTLMWRLVRMSLNPKVGMLVAVVESVVILEPRELLGVQGLPLLR